MSSEYKEYGWEAGEAHMQARIWQGVLRLVAATEGRGWKVGMFEGAKVGTVKGEGLSVTSEEDRNRRTEVGGRCFGFLVNRFFGEPDKNGRGSEAGGDLLTQLRGKRVLDVGCGNGFMCGQFLKLGCEVTGIDLSEQGIAHARAAYPGARFEVAAAYGDLLQKLGKLETRGWKD
jgi:2-polyprenyl-3-methyl-5-hydroxy-6-metoxy-1,4-benzoquinol methylase